MGNVMRVQGGGFRKLGVHSIYFGFSPKFSLYDKDYSVWAYIGVSYFGKQSYEYKVCHVESYKLQ